MSVALRLPLRARSSGFVRALLTAGLVLGTIGGLTLDRAWAAAAVKQRFDVPAGQAEPALKRFSDQSGRQVIFPTALVRGVRTNAVKGDFTAHDALEQMLAGTGLTVGEDRESNAFAVRRGPQRPNAPRAPPPMNTGDRPQNVRRKAHATAPAEGSRVIVLDPFTIEADDAEGYRVQSSVSGLPFVAPLESIPLPVNVLTSDFIADIGSFSVEDALRYVSGVANGERNEAGTERYTLRGFRTNSLYFNGSLMNTPTDTSIVERVEVLKGPSTIVYGVLDPAGLVNVVTKRPTHRDRTQYTQTWGEYGTTRSTLDVNRTLVAGAKGGLKVSARIVGTASTEKSNLPAEFRDRFITAPSVRFDFGRSGNLMLGYIGNRERGRINRQTLPQANDGGAALSAIATGHVPVIPDFTWVTPQDQWHYQADYYDLQWSQRLRENLHVSFTYARNEIDADQYFFLGTSTIRPTEAGEYWAGGRMTTQVTHRETEVYAVKAACDFSLAGGEHRLSLLARRTSLGFFHYGFYDLRTPVLGPYLIADRSGPRFIRFAGQPRRLTDPRSPDAVPAIADVASVTSGPAMDWNVALIDYAAFLSGRLNLLGGAQYSTIRAQDKRKLVPQFGAVYRLGAGINLYGLYSRTFSPNGRSDSTDPDSPFLPPENGIGLEAGLKLAFADGRATGTLAAYRIDRDNVRQVLVGLGGLATNTFVPSGEERAEGFEADVLLQPAPGLQLNLGYAYTDSVIARQSIDENNPDRDGDGVSDAVGLKKEGVAKHDVRLWARYDFPSASSFAGLALGGGYTWRQGPIQLYGTYRQRLVAEPGNPQRLDLFASYDFAISDRNACCRLNWQNATDRLYQDRRGKFVSPSMVSLTLSLRL